MPIKKPVLIANPVHPNEGSFGTIKVIAEGLIGTARTLSIDARSISSVCKDAGVCDLPSPTAQQKKRAIELLSKESGVSYVISLSANVCEPMQINGVFVEYNAKRPGALQDAELLYYCIEQSWAAAGPEYNIRGNRPNGAHIKAMGGFENFLYDATSVLPAAVSTIMIKNTQREDALDALQAVVDNYRKGLANGRFDELVESAIKDILKEREIIYLIKALATNYGTSATLFAKNVGNLFIPSLTIWLGNYYNPSDNSAMETGVQNYVNGILEFLKKSL